MLQFHKKLNDQEQILGVYISSTNIDKMCMIIVAYFRDLFMTQKVRSPLQQPIILLFDPELKNNKLDIKVSSGQTNISRKRNGDTSKDSRLNSKTYIDQFLCDYRCLTSSLSIWKSALSSVNFLSSST